MARPKSEKPALPYSVRLTADLRSKFEYLAAKERRAPRDLLRLLVEDAVAAYEAEHGPIQLPPPPPQHP